MADSTTLAPCPFCGGIPTRKLGNSDKLVMLVCPPDSACADSGLCTGYLLDDEAQAIAAWNRCAQPATALMPLPDGRAKEVLWAEHLRWMEAAGLDTEGMRPTGEWLEHWLIYVRSIEAAHGITKGET